MNAKITMYLFAGFFMAAGLFLILFPGTAWKWFDRDPRYQIRQTPKALQLNSEGSMRALGVGLILVAGLVAYYSYTVRWPTP